MLQFGLHWSGQREDEDDIDMDGVESEQSTGSSIRPILAQVLEHGGNVTGAFSFMQTHPVAPNPGLHVNGLGTLGLPLSLRDAAAVKACAELAASNSTANENVSTKGGYHWEISASNVQFEGSGWTTFIDDALRKVCTAFAVHSKTSKPRYELSKLALYETGYSSPSSMLHKGCSSVLAAVMIILPSRYSGGAICLSHGDRKERYDCSSESLTNTTVLAWFGGCTHEVQPLSGGFRLSLHYDLIHTTELPMPSLSDQDEVVSRLHDLFSNWISARQSSNTPRKIICLLKEKHSIGGVIQTPLSGADARWVSLLSNVGKLSGFRVGLATLICTERGLGELQREYYGDDDWTEGANDVSMVEVNDRETAITSLVSLDGRLISASLEHDLKREGIPTGIVKLVTSKRPDKQMYAYENSEHMSFKQVFHRTVAVIWPQWAEFDLVHGPDGFLGACKQLRACNTVHPNAEQSELVEAILARTQESTSEAVMSSVGRAALMWGDLSLWLRTVKACDAERSISAMETENIYRAVSTFSFGQVHECLQQALQRDPSDVDALQFLLDFEEWVSEQGSTELSANVNPWIAAQRTKRLDNLQGPIERDYEALIELIVEHGDADELEKKVFPYIVSTASNLVLVQCANLLGGEGQGSTNTSVNAHTRIVANELLTIAHPRINFRPMPSNEEAADHEDLLELLQLYIKGCINLERHDLLSAAWPRLKDVSGLSCYEIRRHIEHTFFPLISDIAEITPDAYANEVSTLCGLAVSLWLDALADPDVPDLTEDVVLSMLYAVSASKQTSLVDTRVIPKFKADGNETRLRVLLDGLHANRSLLGPHSATILLSLLNHWITITPQPLGSSEVVDYVVGFDIPEACSLLFQPLLNPPVLDRAYVKSQLATVLLSFCSSLTKHKLSSMSPHFAPTLRAIMRHWAEKVMVPRPTYDAFRPLTALIGWKCSCKPCKPVRDFLQRSSEEVWTGRIGKQSGIHVSTQLGMHARLAAEWKALPSRGNGEPHGLEVKKNRSIAEASQWSHHRSMGLDLLKAISGDAAELQAIFGEDYSCIMASLEEPKPPANLAPAARHVQDGSVAQVANVPSGSGKQGGFRRGDAIAGPPAKRRKTAYNGKDVIDLSD